MAAPSHDDQRMNLRDALLQGLAGLPGTRTFHIHALVSSPRKHSSLYRYASPRPKTYLQNILVLLSEQPTVDAPRVFVSAIEASLYHIPTTSSGVLYISKVDSTGQGASPSPTQALVRAFLSYYVDPATRPLPVADLWVHLFARAQNQYLFPNSAEFAGKRPLTDMVLCAWWKRQLSRVAEGVTGRASVRLFHLLPGMGEAEATQALERVYGGTSVAWTYGHPYEEESGIGNVVPWFDDDPKARFLDEIAYTTEEGVRSPARKRARTAEGAARAEEDGPGRALKKVSIGEFWERMSFRQECVAGAVTGFFVVVASSAAPGGEAGGGVSWQLMKRVATSLTTGHEFSTTARAEWSTRVLEEAIQGLCGTTAGVHGTVSVRNGPRQDGGGGDGRETIRVLTARRKKRVVD